MVNFVVCEDFLAKAKPLRPRPRTNITRFSWVLEWKSTLRACVLCCIHSESYSSPLWGQACWMGMCLLPVQRLLQCYVCLRSLHAWAVCRVLRVCMSLLVDLYIHFVPKKEATKLLTVSLPNLNQFQKFFHRQTQLKIFYTALCSHFTIPNVCRYTTLWNMNDRKTNKMYRVPKTSRCVFVIAWPDDN